MWSKHETGPCGGLRWSYSSECNMSYKRMNYVHRSTLNRNYSHTRVNNNVPESRSRWTHGRVSFGSGCTNLKSLANSAEHLDLLGCKVNRLQGAGRQHRVLLRSRARRTAIRGNWRCWTDVGHRRVWSSVAVGLARLLACTTLGLE